MTGTAAAPVAVAARDLLAPAARRLAQAGIEGAAREARLLLALVVGCDPGRLVVEPDRRVDAGAVAVFETALARRCAREPFSHIAGVREFWGLPFRVSSAVLDPRPDSETLVDAACAHFPDRDAPLRVLDLGTGSGCLLLAVLSEYPRASGIGVDICEDALAVACDNATQLGVESRAQFLRADWGAGLAARFDLVLCNPPYVAAEEIKRLEPEVARFEPHCALDGGPDGLDAYRALAPALAGLLAPGGLGVVEVGVGQASDVQEIFEASGLAVGKSFKDLAGVPRCLAVTMPGTFTDC